MAKKKKKPISKYEIFKDIVQLTGTIVSTIYLIYLMLKG